MADEEVKPSEEAAPSKGPGLAPILALVAVVVVGVGLALVVQWVVSPDDQGDEQAQESEDAGMSLIKRAEPIDLDEIVANVQGESGRRYVKIRAQLWIGSEDVPALTDPKLMPIMKEVVRGTLSDYKMDELEAGNIDDSLRRNFKENLNKELREVLEGGVNPDRVFIERVVLADFLIQ